MVLGLNSFKNAFSGFAEQYTIIGGAACDLLMSKENMEFRATKDLDIVLIVEALTPEFVNRFWYYVKEAGYEHQNKSTGEVEFYRFSNPKSKAYPKMIELFSRKPDMIKLPEGAVLTPLPMDDELSSLSAILLNDSYYNFLLSGITMIDGVSILNTTHIIPFKAKAWLDLSQKKQQGMQVDSKSINKHKRDVFRLAVLLREDQRVYTSTDIYKDVNDFIDGMDNEEVNLKDLGIYNLVKEDVLHLLQKVYVEI